MNTLRRYTISLMCLLLTGTVSIFAQSTQHYIQSNGTSNYYPTNYKPNSDTKVIITFDFVDCEDVNDNDRGRAIFGSGAENGKGAADFWLSTDRNAGGHGGQTELRVKTGSKTVNLTWPLEYNSSGMSKKRYRATVENGCLILELSEDFGKTWKEHNSATWTPDPSFKSTLPMYIGAVSYGGTNFWPYRSPIRLYEMVIEEKGQVLHHYIPALQEGTSFGHLYDRTTDTNLKDFYFDEKNIPSSSCEHKYVTDQHNGNAKCLICNKKDIKWNDWAKDHHDSYGITAVDPFLDVNNLDDNSKPLTTLMLAGIGGMKDYVVIDKANNSVIASGTSKSFESSKQIALPNCDTKRDLYVNVLTKSAEKRKVDGKEVTDSVTVYAVIDVEQKPLHMPHEVTVSQKPDIQKDGRLKPYNEIKWFIENPFNDKDTLNSNDLMKDDVFMVYRAFKSDFSDEEALTKGVSGVADYTMVKDDKTGRGYYTILDKELEGQYNPDKKNRVNDANDDILKQLKDASTLTSLEKLAITEFYKGRSQVYYRVTRALTDGLWGEDAKEFSVRKTLTLHNMLPPVTGIKVEKTSNWSSDKKVNLKVSLKNPYVWEFNSALDSAKIHKLIPEELAYRRYVWDDSTKVVIKRFSPTTEYDHDTDMAAETIVVEGKDVKWNEATGSYEVTVQDIQALPYTHYYYTAEIDTTSSVYPAPGAVIPLTTTEDEANDCYSKTVASIGNFTATRGEYNGGVELNWQMGINPSNFGNSSMILTRREYKGLDDSTGKIAYADTITKPLDLTLSTYEDTEALPGHVYEYTLTSIFTFRGAEYKTEATALGWPSHRGFITGKVLMPNGTAVKGAKVYVRSKDAIDIPDVRDEYGKIIMQGVHTGITTDAKGSASTFTKQEETKKDTIVKYQYTYNKEFITDDYGEYRDTVDFQSEGTQYEVSVIYGNSSFKWNGNATAILTLSKSKFEYKNVNMISDKAFRFIGNVLYENSTMPVHNASFELLHYDGNRKVIQREIMRDQNGDTIRTDHQGAFSICLLPASVGLRVVKDGHTMKDGGFIRIGGDTIFTPNKEQAGLRLWDQTKVQMIGRLVGGNIQGNKPLGKGMSRNNLGDDLTIELQLEGDNTSQIVYLQNDPDNTTIKKTFDHPVFDSKNKSLGYKTNVSYERKRIVIKPDSVTGEFFLQLPPSKYKVTRLSSKGYASFYQPGEGIEVLDYTNSKDTVFYNRIYHKPATVTYTQYNRGRQTGYLGESEVPFIDLYGHTYNIPIASDTINVKTKEKAACYNFKHPVFNSGTQYLLEATVHEDYYYNNDDKSGVLDMVRLDGGKLHVRNGMMSDNADKTYTLDKEGSVFVYLTADNPNFTNTGEEALRTVTMQVEYKDFYYNAKPISAFVLGEKDKGTDMVPIAEGLQLVDIIRDPYGARSYAWREKGTSYHWAFDKTHGTSSFFNANLTTGGGSDVYFGFGAAVKTSFSATISGNLTVSNIKTDYERKLNQYNMTISERISTSADPLDVGAMADVYVGVVNEVSIGENTSVAVIGKNMYDVVKENVTLVAKADTSYIVIGDTYRAEIAVAKSDFAYSQKHILGTLIPDLKQKRDALLLANVTDWDIAKKIADGLQTPQYFKDTNGDIIMVTPDDKKNHPNLYMKYDEAISQWEGLVRKNEIAKLEAMKNDKGLLKQYSVATTSVDYSRAADTYQQHFSWELPQVTTGGLSAGTKKGGNGTAAKPNNLVEKNPGVSRPGTNGQNVWAGVILELSLGGGWNETNSVSREYYKTESAGFGFHLDTNDNGYMTMGVYEDISNETTHTTIANNSTTDVMSSDKKNIKYDYDSEYVNGEKGETNICNFIYRLEGGATRQPWYAADVTQLHRPGTALGNATKKIDNPKIYIDAPVVSNQPEDRTATFQIRLTNETEIADNTKYLNPSVFKLLQIDGTNPNGAKLFIDGAPLGDGRTFILAPGESIVKILEVQKGVGYNFNDIKLRFRDDANSLMDDASFSVNYMPMATDVKVTAPSDKWVMNTLSDADEKGFYIPVSVGDFNVNSEGFHHIELQYKKQTEGNSQWVTFDSFYKDKALMDAATGTKHLIDNGKISNVKFYGEKDPMEMKYDLRAVSFRELGTGFVTRASDVVSGTKDTRCPEVFGLPTPASGILTQADVIQFNFTEPIAYNYLDKISDFQIQGYTNESNIALSSSLMFNGKEEQKAFTTVKRNLNHRSFSIDMMVKTAEVGRDMVFFSHGNDKENMSFGITSDSCLFARISGYKSVSKPLSKYGIDITQSLTHVGMIYDNETGKVDFFAGGSIIDNKVSEIAKAGYSGNGTISLGRDVERHQTDNLFKGNMLEVRVWGKKLSKTLISQYNGKLLNGYETQLLAHWPMTETTGNIIKESVHGANITLSGDIQWANIDGYSLLTDNEPVQLNPDLITASADDDYSLSFWFKVDKMNSDTLALFSAGDKHMAAEGKGKLFIGFQGDDLVVVSNNQSYEVAATKDVADEKWHHFAMTVNRSKDQFCTYIDGTATNISEACRIDGIANDYIAFGDYGLMAHFDVFTRWEQAVPKYIVQEYYNMRFSGKELGMKAYLPFTVSKESDQGVMYSDSCAYNCTYSKDENGNWVQSKQRMVIGNFKADKNLDKEEHAPIREMPSLENLDFSWSSTGTALQININRADKDINKQTILVTVRNIEDEYGNVLKSPQMLTYFVDKNLLKWDNQTIYMECNESEEATQTVSWRNISGKRISFYLDDMPSWLHANYTEGIADPQEESSITFTADKGLAAGSYDATIYLTDDNGLADPIFISLTVKPAECGWNIDRTVYDRTMNLRAIVKTKNCNGNYVINTDPHNKVGAFIGNECVGIANIAEEGRLYMTIYGDTMYAKIPHNITFRLWMHETGEIFEMENLLPDKTFGSVKFKTNSAVGLPPNDPITLVTSEKKVQSLNLNKGWNWVSFYLQPDATEGVNSIFINQKGLFSDGDIIKHVDFAQYSENTLDWMGYLNSTDYHNVYQIYVNNPGIYRIMGYELTDEQLVVPVNPGWNDVPYLLTSSTTIDNALADFLINDKAQTGDIIKSIDEFAVADGSDGHTKWVGTLKYMQPGVGYYLYHHGNATSFKYQPNVIAVNTESKASTINLTDMNMPVIATIADGMDIHQGDTIVAIAGGKIVGSAAVPADNAGMTRAADNDHGNLMFISVNALNGNGITFGLCRGGEVIATTTTPLPYNSNAVVGKLDNPYVIDFSETATLHEGDIYDLSGKKMNNTALPRGIYINGNVKVAK